MTSTLLVDRQRFVGKGMREDIVLRNLGSEPTGCTLTLHVEADFADLFEVKASHIRSHGVLSVEAQPDGLRLGIRWRDQTRGVRVAASRSDAVVAPHLLTFPVVVPARGVWQTTVHVYPLVDGKELPTPFPDDSPVEQTVPGRQLEDWRRYSPRVVTEHPGLELALKQSSEDLGALRIFDAEHPASAAVAAGAPWFMTLFGRDSLITSFMALPVDQSLALGTLQTLARYQGVKEDQLTEEEPGRILHEVRSVMEATSFLGGGNVYYGSADATPLFVMLLGELRRWGLAREEVDALLPHADRALEWVEEYGDRDGDGFVEYQRKTDRGLLNQGWKDSSDGVNFADGRVAVAPMALCEVQAYVYAAYIARCHFAREAGDEVTADHWASKAATLKQLFNERFWLPDRGWFAIALDRDKRPVDALTSNMGHCLWTGIVDEEKAELVAERLLSPEMFTGWGVRTLASTMGAYNPMSYHNGSVWPHDNALIAAGLMRYGFAGHAQRVAQGILDAAVEFGGRLPELFCGFDREDYPQPVPYPTSCSPQAWAAASPVHLLRVLLRFDPWVPYGKVWIAPALPPSFGDLEITNLPLAGSRLVVEVRNGKLLVGGLPEHIELIQEPRKPITAAVPSDS